MLVLKVLMSSNTDQMSLSFQEIIKQFQNIINPSTEDIRIMAKKIQDIKNMENTKSIPIDLNLSHNGNINTNANPQTDNKQPHDKSNKPDNNQINLDII